MDKDILCKTLAECCNKISLLSETQKDTIVKFEDNICIDGKIIGTGQSDYTKDSNEYTLNTNGKLFTLIDIPGIEGNEKAYETIIQKAINKAHIVIYVNGSDKKPEVKTVLKIKKYLKNDSDVYAVCNIHCMPKKNRDILLDGTFEEEIKEAYRYAEEKLVIQTENVLKPVLGINFKKSLYINGLLAFCSVAYDKNKQLTTIIRDTENKRLRSDQFKFVKELNNDYRLMQELSRLNTLTNVITEHINNFDTYIIESNKRKLLNRLNSMKEKVDSLKNYAKKSTQEFDEVYDRLEQEFIIANKNFKLNIEDIPREAVQNMTSTYLEKLYDIIEKEDGKVDNTYLKNFFNDNEEAMQKNVADKIQNMYENANEQLKNEYEEAQKRFKKDLQRALAYKAVYIPELGKIDVSEIANSLSYSLDDFAENAFTVGSMALTGFLVGTAIPGIGNILGAAIGAVVGIVFSFIGFFTSRASRISKAKRKAMDVFDDIEIKLIKSINDSFVKNGVLPKINKQEGEIHQFIKEQKKQLMHINSILNRLSINIENKIIQLGGLGNGKI